MPLKKTLEQLNHFLINLKNKKIIDDYALIDRLFYLAKKAGVDKYLTKLLEDLNLKPLV